MAGNVWEWTDDWFTRDASNEGCCVPQHPVATDERIPRRELLPALPAGRPPGRGDRHLDSANRLSLRDQELNSATAGPVAE
jgi:hypothetical protein